MNRSSGNEYAFWPLRALPWGVAVLMIAWKFEPEIRAFLVKRTSSNPVENKVPDSVESAAFLKTAAEQQRLALWNLENYRRNSRKQAYTDFDVEMETANRMGMTGGELKARIRTGKGSDDTLSRAYAHLLSGERTLAASEAKKTRIAEISNVNRVREAHWIEAQAHMVAGNHDSALQSWMAAAALCDGGADSDTWADMQYGVAHALERLNRFAEAEVLFQKVYEVRTDLHGQSDPESISALLGVAVNRFNQSKDEEGEATLVRIREIKLAGLEADMPNVASELRAKARTAFELGNYAEASLAFRELLKDVEKELGADHSDVAIVLHNLSGVLLIEENYPEAEAFSRRAVNLFFRHRKLNGIPHRHELTAVELFLEILKKQEKSQTEIDNALAQLKNEWGL